MNIIIIEDEQKAALDLAKQLKMLDASVHVLAVLDSIESSIEWFNTYDMPDLIFMDIRLGDGNSLTIFDKVDIQCPVIFCTAFDEYMLEAFKVNGIAYIVKPFTKQILQQALNKYKLLKEHFVTDAITLKGLAAILQQRSASYRSSYLVNYKTKMLPVAVNDIGYFYVDKGVTYIVTGKDEFVIPQTLDTIEKEIDPSLFYRVNRQYIVARSQIKEIEHYGGRKVEVIMKIPASKPVIISKEKSSGFIKWMENR